MTIRENLDLIDDILDAAWTVPKKSVKHLMISV